MHELYVQCICLHPTLLWFLVIYRVYQLIYMAFWLNFHLIETLQFVWNLRLFDTSRIQYLQRFAHIRNGNKHSYVCAIFLLNLSFLLNTKTKKTWQTNLLNRIVIIIIYCPVLYNICKLKWDAAGVSCFNKQSLNREVTKYVSENSFVFFWTDVARLRTQNNKPV